MAKRKGRKKFRAYLRGAVNHELQLSTLAARTLIGSNVADTLQEQVWLSSVSLRWAVQDITQAFGTGPVMVGVCHSDYTDAEIEAWIENLGSWERGDLTSQEVSRRKIRMVGIFEGPASS